MEGSDAESSDSDSPYEYFSSCESSEEDEICDIELPLQSPWASSLGEEELDRRVIELTTTACCGRNCLNGKEETVRKFLFSTNEMTKEARKTSYLTAIAISAATDTGMRHRGDGKRVRYAYLLPFCGLVCKTAFQAAFNVSNATLLKARKQVEDGEAFVRPHQNTNNKFAVKLDEEKLVSWFRDVATKIGEHCPVKFQRQRSSDGVVVRYTTREDITFLPAFTTWKSLFKQYEIYLDETEVDHPKPSFPSFYKILQRRCKDIRIQSPRSNVCDTCVLYRVASSRTATTLETENQAAHALDARAMR